MNIQKIRAKREFYEDANNFAMQRLCTMIIWRKLHGLDSAAKIGVRLQGAGV